MIDVVTPPVPVSPQRNLWTGLVFVVCVALFSGGVYAWHVHTSRSQNEQSSYAALLEKNDAFRSGHLALESKRYADAEQAFSEALPSASSGSLESPDRRAHRERVCAAFL